jgi:periplasmic divalent cation tolerance protein
MAAEGGDMTGSGAEYLQVQTTTDSRTEAMELARLAVELRLAACAQVVGPMTTTYWWDQGIERAEEWMIILKLPGDRYDELTALLTERHSYDEPEIVATPIITGSESYLNWIMDETRPRSAENAGSLPAGGPRAAPATAPSGERSRSG